MAAVDYFLKVDGIPGESQDAKHKGEIDVVGWSWGETAAVQGGAGRAGAGKVQLQDFHFTSRISKASPKLMEACASGKHIKSAVLSARKAGEGKAEFLSFSLSDVLISSYQTGVGESDGAPIDTVALSFSSLEVEYRETKPDGSIGASIRFGWDAKRNKPL